jgi:hypothetical protein
MLYQKQKKKKKNLTDVGTDAPATKWRNHTAQRTGRRGDLINIDQGHKGPLPTSEAPKLYNINASPADDM